MKVSKWKRIKINDLQAILIVSIEQFRHGGWTYWQGVREGTMDRILNFWGIRLWVLA